MNKLKIVAYIRVSTTRQDVENQRLAIHDYVHRKHLSIDHFVDAQVSSRKASQRSGVDKIIEGLEPGDTLVVSELSRLGRSLGQIIQIVDQLVQRKIQFTAIKENISLNGKQDLRTKVMIALFGLFAEVERDLISERTKEGLAAAKAKGKLLGRPKGSLAANRSSMAKRRKSGDCSRKRSPRRPLRKSWTCPAPRCATLFGREGSSGNPGLIGRSPSSASIPTPVGRTRAAKQPPYTAMRLHRLL